MSKTKAMQSTWLQRFSVKVKARVPVGVVLTPSETVALADIYDQDVSKLKDNQQSVLKAVGATFVKDTRTAITKATSARASAAATYKQTKDPIKKREWARRLVVADETLKSMREMRERMTTTHDRLQMIKGDIELQIMQAEAKAAEARAYAEAGEQLRLAGEKLVDARTRAKNIKFEYKNLEITMEGAEQAINDADVDDLLAQANKIAGLDIVEQPSE